MTLQEFLEADRLRNAWLREPRLSVYVRRGIHMIEHEGYRTLDIASIEVDDGFRGQGIFTDFLGRAEAVGVPVFIENVMDLRFQEFFRNRGYKVQFGGDESVGVLSFYKIQ